MPDGDSVLALLSVLKVIRSAFAQERTFGKFVAMAMGWILAPHRRRISQSLLATGLASQQHHNRFYRLFSRDRWDPDELGRLFFLQIVRLVGTDAALSVAVDDTVAHHKGPKVFALGTHLDAARSTRKFRIFCFGHCWVFVAVTVVFSGLSSRPFALPVLLRLHRNKKECERSGAAYRKKTELAREMLDILASWTTGRRVEVAADSAYCCDTVTRGLPEHLVLFGSMRPDAVLTEAPEEREPGTPGRPRVRGRVVLPKPKALARDESVPWQTAVVEMYGRSQIVAFKSLVGQWYRACGGRLLRIVVVRVPTGAIPCRVFFSMDPTLEPEIILARYARRWSIEVTFRNLKQLLGFEHPQVRVTQSVLRMAPFVAMLYTAIVLWYVEHACHVPSLAQPVGPWYRQKNHVAFEDMIYAARKALIASGVFDPTGDFDNLRNWFKPPDDGQLAA